MTVPAFAYPPNPNHGAPVGGTLISLDGRSLPLVGVSLTVDARGGVARVILEQRFRNPHGEPLQVTYALPLPVEAAVTGFSFRMGETWTHGRVERREDARRAFEDAILEGRTASLLDQERSSLFTQQLGNIPPRSEVQCQLELVQRLVWNDTGWEWRFPTVVAPRYLGAAQRVLDADRVTVEVVDGEFPITTTLAVTIRDVLSEQSRPQSPSHMVHSARSGDRTVVTLGDERGAKLDRDVVVRWPVARMELGASLDVGRPVSEATGHSSYGLITLVPPRREARAPALGRDLIVLLDTSGSMNGQPIAQAKRITSVLVDSLTEQDSLEMISFSSTPTPWRHTAVNASDSFRRDAQAWISRLEASGGTEMRTGIFEAMKGLHVDRQRQVVLITDGLIGFEQEVIAAVTHRLPHGSRVHVVGVGSSVNRSLTSPVARAGRGLELVIGLDESVEPFVQRLLARTVAPLCVDVQLSGSALLEQASAHITDLYAGAPVLVPVRLRPEGGTLRVRSSEVLGFREDELIVPALHMGEGSSALAPLFAREKVEALELQLAAGAYPSEIDTSIEFTGLQFQIATRRTSWVATSAFPTVDPRQPRRRETMPHAVPAGMSVEAVGLRQPPQRQMARKSMVSSRAAYRDEQQIRAITDGVAPSEAGPHYEQEPAELPVRGKVSEEAQKSEKAASSPPRLSTPSPSRNAPASGMSSTVNASQKIRGRTRRSGHRLILEIELQTPHEWAPPTQGRVLIGNTVFVLEVSAHHSTAPGSYPAGVMVTVVFVDVPEGEILSLGLHAWDHSIVEVELVK